MTSLINRIRRWLVLRRVDFNDPDLRVLFTTIYIPFTEDEVKGTDLFKRCYDAGVRITRSHDEERE